LHSLHGGLRLRHMPLTLLIYFSVGRHYPPKSPPNDLRLDAMHSDSPREQLIPNKVEALTFAARAKLPTSVAVIHLFSLDLV